MELKFSSWLKKNEVATSTNSVANFARPIMGLVRRGDLGVWGEEDPFFKKKKKINEADEYKKISDGVIKIPVPNVQQTTNFSCGAAVVQSIMSYFGVGPDSQEEYMKGLSTSKD